MRNLRSLLLLPVVLLCFALPGAARAQAPDAASKLPASVQLRELERDAQTVWLYVPAGREPSALVVIPPSGGTLLTAPPLTLEDRPDHLPYVEAGFAVVAFSLSGTLSGTVTEEQVQTAIGDFAKARTGVLDAEKAIAVALAEVPALADRPIFAAGHSSAANLAIALAAEEPRIRAVAAYAPVADAPAFVEGNRLERMARDIPGALDINRELSPLQAATKIQSAVFLFHAEDDDVAPVAGTRELARILTEHGHAPELRIVKTGGHSDAFSAEGLPAGVAWFAQQLQAPRP
jgi:dipeptidyl aminopeptidase/acylaminoacyl peptidase